MNLKPSEAQIAAGNYEKRHDKFQGLNLSIENPKGSERRGIGKDGNPWSVKMPHDYGYIKRTEGADGDQVDVYVGNHKKSPHVFIIDQHDADSGEFDEHKVMLGFANPEQATRAYDRGFSDGNGPARRRALLHMGMDDFKKWLAAGNAKKSVKGFARGGRINKAEGGGVWLKRPGQETEAEQPEQPKENKYNAFQAGLMGLSKGATANWDDEMMGASAASGIPAIAQAVPVVGPLIRPAVGAVRAALSDDSRKIYEQERDKVRQMHRTAEEEHPAAHFAGEIGGSLLLPTGKMGTAAQAAKAGAAYGFAAGAGEGEGATDTAIRAGTGSLLGAGVGAIAPKVSEKLGDAASWLSEKIGTILAPMQRMKDPETQGVKYFLEKMKMDVDSGKALTAEQRQAAEQMGLPLMAGDLGGEEVRGLARWASDISPTARAKMVDELDERYRGQQDRLSSAISNLTAAPNARVAREALDESAKVANGPAYKAAMEQGNEGFRSQLIDDLMEAPVMQDAVTRAGKAMKNKLASGRVDRAYVELEDGTKLPTLSFMDQVKKELGSMYEMAARSGDKSLGADITLIKQKLTNELDTLFPQYQKARGIAAEFFKADDAIDAGKQMFKLANSPELYDSGVLKLMEKMSSHERGLVASGYLTAMTDKIRAENYSADAVKRILKSPQAKELNERLLGTRKHKEMESMIYLEGYANLLRNAVEGNSKTNQFMEAAKKIGRDIGWAGAGAGAGTIFGGGVDPRDPSSWPGAIGGLMFKRGRDKYIAGVNEKFANKIADLVISRNPDDFKKAAQIVAKNPYARRALEQNYDKAVKMIAPQTNTAAVPLERALGTKLLPAGEDQQ